MGPDHKVVFIHARKWDRASVQFQVEAHSSAFSLFISVLGLVWQSSVSALSGSAVLTWSVNQFHKVVWLRPPSAQERKRVRFSALTPA